jgi:hypothetical protein
MSKSEQSGRRLKLTLVVRDEKDDPSILDIVRIAGEDGLRTPAIGPATPAQEEPKEQNQQPERHSPVDEKLETAAREAIGESLAKVIEQFQATGQEPKFDPAKWAEQLSKVWAVIHKAKAAGVQLHITPAESLPPPEEP